MKVLGLCREKDSHPVEIAEELMVSPKRVLKALQFLEVLGLLEKVDEQAYGTRWCQDGVSAVFQEV